MGVNCTWSGSVFFADAMERELSGTHTFSFTFSSKFYKICYRKKNFHLSHNYYKPSLENMTANLRRHNLKYDPRITTVEVFSASKTCIFF